MRGIIPPSEIAQRAQSRRPPSAHGQGPLTQKPPRLMDLLAQALDLVLHLDRHLGALSWVLSLSFAGYQFGNLPWIQRNLSAVILGIIVVSLLPAAIAWLRERRPAAARRHQILM